jgi:hypothetical protein
MVKGKHIVQGDFKDYLKFGARKQKYVIHYSISIRKMEDIKYKNNALKLTFLNLRNYLDSYEMMVAFKIVKND